jgi:hypothetical protein
MSAPTARKQLAMPSDPKQHARTIAEAVDQAWHGQFGGSRIEIPISVVAALSLVAPADPTGPDPATLALRLDRHGFAALLQHLWCQLAVLRPDLLPRTKPLWEWLDADDLDDQLLRAVHATGQAALRHGQLDLTGVRWRRHDVDLLGMVLQTIRSRSAIKGRGQYLTPESVTQLIGHMLRPKPGERILEPCAGTGTMLLGAAHAMREAGDDPTTCEWWANDIDWLAAACCAVNLHCWGLGPRVVVGCGDGLTDEWMPTALSQRQAAIDEMQGKWEMARKLAAIRQLLGLPTPEDPLARYLREAQPPAPKPPPPSSTFDADAAYSQGRLF